MTNKEQTISNLKRLKSFHIHNGNYDPDIDRAIKALEQEPCEDWHDVPSDEMTLEQARQAVKDLRKMWPESRKQQTCGDCVSRQAALASIKNLYPDMPIVNIFIARRKWLEKYAPYFECENAIEQLPPVTPQQEIIRCKDCKHWTNNIGNSELRDNYCNEEAHGFYYRCSGDDYCSFAERRNDG